MDFMRIYLLLLLPLWAVLVYSFYVIQSKALQSIYKSISVRFLHKVTCYNFHLLKIHSFMLFIMLMLLTLASAGPRVSDSKLVKAESVDTVIIIDASFSMYAGDVTKRNETEYVSRFDYCKKSAIALLKQLPDTRFGLVTFSKELAMHAPPTHDHVTLEKFIDSLQIHNFENTGTDFNKALESLLFLSESDPDTALTAIIFSDGEDKMGSDVADTLKSLKERGITVHTVAVGSKTGGVVHIFVPEDVFANLKEKRIAKKFTTYRKDGLLKRIASDTGGKFFLEENSETLYELQLTVYEGKENARVIESEAKHDITYIFLLLFLLLYLTDLIVFDSLQALRLWRYRK